MKAVWKVRALNARGELEEGTFTGTLTELAATLEDAGGPDVPVRVIQFVEDVDEAPTDEARGGDAVEVDKG
jgi:hypothetical protein